MAKRVKRSSGQNAKAPAVASRDELIGGLKKMAIIAAVMPNYKKGSRNNVVNALTGALLFYGMAINDIKHIVGVLCDVTNDEEATDRIKCVETTAQRKSANQSVTGEEQLRELIGNDAVASIIGYLGGQKKQRFSCHWSCFVNIVCCFF